MLFLYLVLEMCLVVSFSLFDVHQARKNAITYAVPNRAFLRVADNAVNTSAVQTDKCTNIKLKSVCFLCVI